MKNFFKLFICVLLVMSFLSISILAADSAKIKFKLIWPDNDEAFYTEKASIVLYRYDNYLDALNNNCDAGTPMTYELFRKFGWTDTFCDLAPGYYCVSGIIAMNGTDHSYYAVSAPFEIKGGDNKVAYIGAFYDFDNPINDKMVYYTGQSLTCVVIDKEDDTDKKWVGVTYPNESKTEENDTDNEAMADNADYNEVLSIEELPTNKVLYLICGGILVCLMTVIVILRMRKKRKKHT